MALLSEFHWLEFILAVLLIELTPGPNMAWLAAVSLADGRAAGLSATAGIAIGLAVNAVLAALGLAALVEAQPAIQQVLRWAGACLMLWLAWQAWRDADGSAVLTSAIDQTRRKFTTGLLVNLLNPKSIVFFVAVVPPFLDGRRANLPLALALAGTSVAIATGVHLAIVLSAAHAHGWVSDPQRTRNVRRIMAMTMVLVAVWLAFGEVR